ncbi:MAG TPA: DnaJ domain-containing protein [Devosia sp.]|nr:DnaJ domain-containing protein [Devosia sp.]
MKLQSKLFDNIRIRPRREEKPAPVEQTCDWEGCEAPGTHKAPKGHRSEGQYHHFCLEHVRHYNTAFNFFAGMDKDELDEALHTPPKAETRSSFATGQAGARNSRAANAAGLRPGDKYGDPFGVFARYRHRQAQTPASERVKPLHEQDRRALETLGIMGHAKSDEIKRAYKTLVKIHHPDANGGDKSSEDRLRAIIAAYSHLKKTGFVTR